MKRNIKGLLWVLLLFVQQVHAQNSMRFQEEVDNLIKGDSAIRKKNIILFTGSSSVRVWTSLQADFPKHNVLNRGFGGSEMADLINFVDKLIVPYHPKQIFIYEGDNDIGTGKKPDEILAQAQQLLMLIREKLPKKTEVLFISPKPSILRWQLKDTYLEYNKKLEAWTKQYKNVKFIDVWTPMLEPDGSVKKDLFVEDGLHMNTKGYEIWKAVVGKYIR